VGSTKAPVSLVQVRVLEHRLTPTHWVWQECSRSTDVAPVCRSILSRHVTQTESVVVRLASLRLSQSFGSKIAYSNAGFQKKGDVGSRFQGCDECGRLWEAYENATFKRVRAESVLNMATALYVEENRMQSLKRELEAASQAVEQSHENITQHEATAHGGKSFKKSPRTDPRVARETHFNNC
jgi:hypothetical protein